MTLKHFFRFGLLLFCLANIFHLVSCSGNKVNENDPESVYKDAEEDVKAKRYLMALDKFKSVKNKFPYSNYATAAALRIADVHFFEEQYAEAAAAYENFRDLHPKHEKADYVIFQIGESYFNQFPGNVDRDLTPVSKAIEAYKELVSLYPQSTHVAQAKEHQKQCIEWLAQKEKYIGDFYFKREMYDSAARRYEKLVQRYPGTNFEQYSYWRWGQSLLKQSESIEKTEEKNALIAKVKSIYSDYLSRFPKGEYSSQISKWIEKGGGAS